MMSSYTRNYRKNFYSLAPTKRNICKQVKYYVIMCARPRKYNEDVDVARTVLGNYLTPYPPRPQTHTKNR